MNEPEIELVRAAKRGSREAAGELFDRYWDEARRVARAVCGRETLVDEVAQEAMVQAFASIRDFRGDGPLGAWLRRIVVTRGLNALRFERRFVPLEDAASLADLGGLPLPDPALRRAVASLPTDQQVALRLRYGLDLSPPEIAGALGVALGTVNSRLARALAALRVHLEVADV
ncbi:MAG: RNA polymerase sigma factor [Thermoleophilia bacterium]|nr:RNA polymerase sigma factor [Thermoleophilia bacterium]